MRTNEYMGVYKVEFLKFNKYIGRMLNYKEILNFFINVSYELKIHDNTSLVEIIYYLNFALMHTTNDDQFIFSYVFIWFSVIHHYYYFFLMFSYVFQ
jgi:hypothetical protein